MNRTDLERLSKEELIELIELVLRMQRPDKTSRTSSKPPSTDRKETRENATPGGAKPGHEGHSRKLCDAPDAFEDHEPTQCARCGGAFPPMMVRDFLQDLEQRHLHATTTSDSVVA
jgi:transposase